MATWSCIGSNTRLSRGGRAIDLTAKEYALLEFLMLHRGECVPRSQLLAEVWQMPSDSVTNVVDVYINYLRRKLEIADLHDCDTGLIETVRGRGYRLGGLSCEAGGAEPGPDAAVSGAAYA